MTDYNYFKVKNIRGVTLDNDYPGVRFTVEIASDSQDDIEYIKKRLADCDMEIALELAFAQFANEPEPSIREAIGDLYMHTGIYSRVTPELADALKQLWLKGV